MTDIYNAPEAEARIEPEANTDIASETKTEPDPIPQTSSGKFNVHKKAKKTIKDVKEGEIQEDEEEIVIRQSYLLLGFRLGISLILIVFLYIVFLLLTKLLSAFGIQISPVTNPVVLLSVLGIFTLIAIIIYFKWKTTYYTLGKKSLNFTGGIGDSVTRTLRLDTFAGVTIEQGMLGKILNYGTILLEYQAKEDSTEHLTFFPNPEHYGEMIKDRIKNI